MKKCSKCGRELPKSEFNKNKNMKDGWQSWCKECVAERKRKYREANREKVAESDRKYREANREKVAERNRKYNEANREKVAEHHRKYYKCMKKLTCPAIGSQGAVRLLFTCEVCGKEFGRLKSDVDWKYEHRGILPRFCSLACHNESMRKTYRSPYAKKIARIKKEVHQ